MDSLKLSCPCSAIRKDDWRLADRNTYAPDGLNCRYHAKMAASEAYKIRSLADQWANGDAIARAHAITSQSIKLARAGFRDRRARGRFEQGDFPCWKEVGLRISSRNSTKNNLPKIAEFLRFWPDQGWFTGDVCYFENRYPVFVGSQQRLVYQFFVLNKKISTGLCSIFGETGYLINIKPRAAEEYASVMIF